MAFSPATMREVTNRLKTKMDRFCRTTVHLLFVFMLYAFTPVAMADEEDEEEDEIGRPSVRASAVPKPAGEWQLTLGTSFEDEDDKRTVEPAVGVDYGVADWLEVNFEVPYPFVMWKGNADPSEQDVDGIGDVTLGAKIALVQEARIVLSTSLDVIFPTGDNDKSDELGDGIFQFEPRLLLDTELDPVGIFFGVGAELNENEGSFLYEVTLSREFEDFVIEDLEISLGAEGRVNDNESEFVLTPGVAIPVWDDVEVGIEVPVGLTRDSPNWGINFEIAFEFE